MSNTFGKIFTVTTYGESHGEQVGVIIDGVPSGVTITSDYIQQVVDKRKATKSIASTTRLEEDKVTISSGVFNNITLGTPIHISVKNKSHKSTDYSEIKDVYRPSHGDYVYDMKYGIRDYRGGGRSSGRETVARVIGGAVAKKILDELNIDVIAYTQSIGAISINENINIDEVYQNKLKFPSNDLAEKCEQYLQKIKSQGDSVGGTISVTINNLPVGIGTPLANKLEANLSQHIMTIGGVKGIEFGAGFNNSHMLGSEYNDKMYFDNNVYKNTNNSGGITAGISEGFPITFNVLIKPTPSISRVQHTITKDLDNTTINIKGRHDVCIVPRVLEVIKAHTYIVLVDQLFLNMHSNINNIKNIY